MHGSHNCLISRTIMACLLLQKGLTLSNPIFLPTPFSPALIYFGQERGWWITCNYPTVLKEKNLNMNSPDDFIVYFRLHKIFKCCCLFLFIVLLCVILLEAISRTKSRLPLACFTVENGFSPSTFHISSAANHAIVCCSFFFHFALRNASFHLAFPHGQKMMVFPSFLNFCSSHCQQAE